MAALRVIFFGTPELAGKSLQALIQSPDLAVVAAVCQPDQPRGRGLKLQPPPVKQIALNENIAVLQPERARDPAFQQQLRQLQPELVAVTAYGQILPKSILELPRCGCINVHTSLLPRYRGAAPIQHALMNGDTETGVTIMKMDEGMDTGDILAQRQTQIDPKDDAQTLYERLGRIGAELLVDTITNYVAGRVPSRPQGNQGVSYAPKIKKLDGAIDWNQSAQAIWNRVRALVPWPGAFTPVPCPSGRQMLKIWKAEPLSSQGAPGAVLSADKSGIVIGCGSGALRILDLQREGGKRMSAAEFLAGHPVAADAKWGQP